MKHWFLIELGCAECGDTPLALPRGTYATAEEAKAAAGDQGRWIAHPNGGWFTQWGSGGFWCGRLDSLAASGQEFGDQYDAEYR